MTICIVVELANIELSTVLMIPRKKSLLLELDTEEMFTNKCA